MAPEQREPGMALSERTDIYALGLVLYDLLVGPQAFAAASGRRRCRGRRRWCRASTPSSSAW